MENFKIESRCLKVCYEFKAFIGCMKETRLSKKNLMCSLVKRLGRAVVLKHVAEPLKCSTKLFKHLAKLLKYSADLLKNSLDILKSLAKRLCYNTAHAVLIGHGTRRE